MNGSEFARLVAQGWPEVGVMVISGKASPKEAGLPANAVFVPKPVNAQTLVEKVRSIMSSLEANRTR